jgi:hypothetical protein
MPPGDLRVAEKFYPGPGGVPVLGWTVPGWKAPGRKAAVVTDSGLEYREPTFDHIGPVSNRALAVLVRRADRTWSATGYEAGFRCSCGGVGQVGRKDGGLKWHTDPTGGPKCRGLAPVGIGYAQVVSQFAVSLVEGWAVVYEEGKFHRGYVRSGGMWRPCTAKLKVA